MKIDLHEYDRGLVDKVDGDLRSAIEEYKHVVGSFACDKPDVCATIRTWTNRALRKLDTYREDLLT